MASPKRVEVDRAKARTYYDKARQLCEASGQAFTQGQHDATVVLAIHAGINACDAVCIALAGLRSNDPDHEKAAELLQTLGPRGTFDDQVNRLRRLLKLKNLIEYDNKRATKDDGEQSIRRCSALVTWASEQLVRGGR